MLQLMLCRDFHTRRTPNAERERAALFLLNGLGLVVFVSSLSWLFCFGCLFVFVFVFIFAVFVLQLGLPQAPCAWVEPERSAAHWNGPGPTLAFLQTAVDLNGLTFNRIGITASPRSPSSALSHHFVWGGFPHQNRLQEKVGPLLWRT